MCNTPLDLEVRPSSEVIQLYHLARTARCTRVRDARVSCAWHATKQFHELASKSIPRCKWLTTSCKGSKNFRCRAPLPVQILELAVPLGALLSTAHLAYMQRDSTSSVSREIFNNSAWASDSNVSCWSFTTVKAAMGTRVHSTAQQLVI